ncbi:MAG TPA: hypothetical protein VF173_02850 [Thermoanaerobaculia bacterium]|nr:hypothetical protein [Thermoanaerobaculia bacterium]
MADETGNREARRESVLRIQALAREARAAGDELVALALARLALAARVEETLRWIVDDLGRTFGNVSFELALQLASFGWEKRPERPEA